MEETTEKLPAQSPEVPETPAKPKKKMSKKKIALIIVAVLILVPLASCVYGAMTYKPTLTGTAAATGAVQSTVSFSANVASNGSDRYPVTENTEVAKVHVEVGDSVSAGDLLVEFDNSEAIDNYKRATINYETARLNLNEIETDYWDLKEDLEDLNDDIEFYKEKWKQYEKYAEDVGTEEYNWYNNYYNRWEAARDQRDALEEQIPTADYIRIQQLNFELNQMTLDDAE